MSTARDWAELLRVPALFTVPGDALAGAAATGLRPNPRTLLAMAASLSLYEAGMALNDWADRADDAVERPHRPLPSGRIAPAAALGAAAAFTAGGLALASRAGRPALAVASALAGTVWAYDLGLKHTPAGPAAMAAARGLDLLLGAAATGKGHPAGNQLRAAMPTALVLSAHTLAVTAVSRREAQGGSTAAPLAALAATAALARLLAPGGGGERGVSRNGHGAHGGGRALALQLPAGRRAAATRGLPGSTADQATPVAGRGGAGAAWHSALAADSTPGAWLTGTRNAWLPGLAAGAARAVNAGGVVNVGGVAGAVDGASEVNGAGRANRAGSAGRANRAGSVGRASGVGSVGRANGAGSVGRANGASSAGRASGVGRASAAYAAPGVWRPGTRATSAAYAAPGVRRPGTRATSAAYAAPGVRRPGTRATSAAYAAPGVWRTGTRAAVQAALVAGYAVTAARPLFHAALNPSPQLTQRAVGGGIRAMIPLQAALSARAGALGSALATAALAPAARRFGRKVSVT